MAELRYGWSPEANAATISSYNKGMLSVSIPFAFLRQQWLLSVAS
jgi:hypothetical protein